MNCLVCTSAKVTVLNSKTNLGYEQYRCHTCKKQFNERSNMLFNFIEYPTEVVMMAVHYYYRFKTSLDIDVYLRDKRDLKAA